MNKFISTLVLSLTISYTGSLTAGSITYQNPNNSESVFRVHGETSQQQTEATLEVIDAYRHNTYSRGGLGEFVSKRDTILVVKVTNQSYRKVLQYKISNDASPLPPVWKEIKFDGTSSDAVEWIGRDGHNNDYFEIKISDSNVNDLISLRVFFNPEFNRIPNIGNPTPGYFGPNVMISDVEVL